MAFRAELSTKYSEIRSRATQLKKLANDSKSATLAGPVSANAVRQLLDAFIAGKTELQAAANTPGMVAYARAQEGDATYDVVAEFNAMITACDGVINWIVANIPVANGYVQLEQWSASGVTTRTFTTAHTATLRTVLDAFAATVS